MISHTHITSQYCAYACRGLGTHHMRQHSTPFNVPSAQTEASILLISAMPSQLAHGHNYDACKCPRASCMLLLHPAPTCADGCWCPVPLTFSNLHWWCFSFQQLTLYQHLWWLPSATCAGGLFPSTTCTYI